MSDHFRSEYRTLSPEEQILVRELKAAAEKFYNMVTAAKEMRSADGSAMRALSLSTTKLEEAVMWATKGITA